MHIHLLSSIDVEFFICRDVYVYVCLYIHAHIHMYMCVCAYIHTYMYTKNTYAGSVPRSRSRNCRLNWLLQRRGPWDSSPQNWRYLQNEWHFYWGTWSKMMINHRMCRYESCVQTNPCWTLRKMGILGIMFYPEFIFSWDEATKRHEKIRASETIEKGWKRKRIFKQKGHLCSTRL